MKRFYPWVPILGWILTPIAGAAETGLNNNWIFFISMFWQVGCFFAILFWII